MLFNSFAFIFLFLPVVLFVFYFLLKLNLERCVIFWLAFASLFFYAQWNINYLFLLLSSICFNYLIGLQIIQSHKVQNIVAAKWGLIVGLVVDVLLLGYYKYTNFGITAVDSFFHLNIPHKNIILPLGISFFTFTQIAYIADAYFQKVKEQNFVKYCLFVTYFPHLIAGPILHHGDMIPQFSLDKLKNDQMFRNIYFGLLIFLLGLFKKIMIADPLSIYAIKGFDEAQSLYFVDAWITSLAYTFQLYFDFSGYSDMAVGLGLMLQTKLPINFNCPYRAVNIQDFWRRWHITLSNFLRDYIYIPLGGNRRGPAKLYSNLLITFLIGGLWHGAGWLFLIWGGLHGCALVVCQKFRDLHIKISTTLAWVITFLFINFAWIFFRANSMGAAWKVIKGMFGLNGFYSHGRHLFSFSMLVEKYKVNFAELSFLNSNRYAYICFFMSIVVAAIFTMKSTHDFVKKIRPRIGTLLFFITLTIVLLFNLNKSTEFLYFTF